MARCKRGPSALELVLSPLRVGISIIIAEENPVIAVLAQPAVCFDLQDRFLNTGRGVRRRAKYQTWRRVLPFLSKTALAMGFPWDRTVARVATQPDPFVTASTEDSVGLELSDIWISSEEIDTLLL